MGVRGQEEQQLGAYLKARRARLDPANLGFAPGRRRTPGLRREEVAQRANISPTWYTWLEQGRGGAPSAGALDRIAHALMLTDVEREHLFLLALGRPPERRYRSEDGVTPRLQRVLGALGATPALIRTAAWDVLAWNAAAKLLLIDFDQIRPEERNLLRLMFLNPGMRQAQYDWEGVARYLVSAFRVEATRAGAADDVRPLVGTLRAESPEFAKLWDAGDLLSAHGEVVKHLRHPVLGDFAFEHSSFAVDGRPDLTLLIYNPATDADARKLRDRLREA